MAISPDLTLDELRIALAPAIADAAVFDGWTPLAVINAAAAEGVDPEVAKFAFKAEVAGELKRGFALVVARVDVGTLGGEELHPGQVAARVQPLFVSIDPARDRSEERRVGKEC